MEADANKYTVMVVAIGTLAPMLTTLVTWVLAQLKAAQREQKLDAQSQHLNEQDQKLDQVQSVVNSHRTEMETKLAELERTNQALRDALALAHVSLPPGTVAIVPVPVVAPKLPDP